MKTFDGILSCACCKIVARHALIAFGQWSLKLVSVKSTNVGRRIRSSYANTNNKHNIPLCARHSRCSMAISLHSAATQATAPDPAVDTARFKQTFSLIALFHLFPLLTSSFEAFEDFDDSFLSLRM